MSLELSEVYSGAVLLIVLVFASSVVYKIVTAFAAPVAGTLKSEAMNERLAQRSAAIEAQIEAINKRLAQQNAAIDALYAQIGTLSAFLGIEVGDNEYDTKPMNPTDLM